MSSGPQKRLLAPPGVGTTPVKKHWTKARPGIASQMVRMFQKIIEISALFNDYKGLRRRCLLFFFQMFLLLANNHRSLVFS